MFERLKREREIKQMVVDKINKKIEDPSSIDSEEIEEAVKLQTIKRRIKLNGVGAGDVLKVAANVAVVVVIVGFEMTHIMNQKASRFIKSL